jgi:hypothetical protein
MSIRVLIGMLLIGIVAGCSVLESRGAGVVLRKEGFNDIQQYAKLAMNSRAKPYILPSLIYYKERRAILTHCRRL